MIQFIIGIVVGVLITMFGLTLWVVIGEEMEEKRGDENGQNRRDFKRH